MPEHRVFFALQPDAEAAGRMVRLAEDLRRRHGLRGSPTPASRLHLSLNFVAKFQGPPSRPVIEKACALAAKVAQPAFRVTLNNAESWKGNPPPLVLLGDEGVIGAQLLYTGLHKALVSGTMAPRREPDFWPHVTLLRDIGTAPGASIEPISWVVRDFVLLDSVTGDGRQELLGRWPLAAGGSSL